MSSLIRVPAAERHSHRGSVLLVYVELTPLRALYYPFFWLDPNATIYPSAAILGSESTAQYQTEGEIDMSTAQQAATVVASSSSATRSPWWRSGRSSTASCPVRPPPRRLRVGDVISKVNGFKVSSYLDLQNRLEAIAPGTTVRLEVSAYPAGKPRTVTCASACSASRARTLGVAHVPARGERTKLKIAELVTAEGRQTPCRLLPGYLPTGLRRRRRRRNRLQDRASAGEGRPVLRRDRRAVSRFGLHARAHAGARPGQSDRWAEGGRDRDDVDRRDRRGRRRGGPEDRRRPRARERACSSCPRRSTRSPRHTPARISRFTP